VLGEEYVERSLGQTSEFMPPMQELTTEAALGDATR
jgi:hypothetical protein